VRDSLLRQPAYFCGSVAVGTVAVSFNAGSGGTVDTVWATIEGPHEECAAVLARLAAVDGFVLDAPEPLRIVELAPGEAAEPARGATLHRRPPHP
jgi:hypothetical protein